MAFLPPGDYYCIKPAAIPQSHLEESWALDSGKETIGGISAKGCGLTAVVTPKTRLSLQRAVECIAYYFRREFNYDFVQYGAGEDEDDGHRAYLWTDEQTLSNERVTVFGACCFRWRQWKDVPADFPAETYAFQWIWLHPYQRRKGVLSKAWPYFLARFDPFVPEPPHSPAMEAFLRKNKYDRFLSKASK